MNDDEEHGEGIDPARPTFNHIPNIQNQRSLFAEFDDTLHEEVYLGEYVNPRGRQRGGRL